MDYVTVENENTNVGVSTDETVSVLFAQFERATNRIECLEHDVHHEQRSNAILVAQLRQSENMISVLTERVRVLEVGRVVGMVNPYSVGDAIEVLNFTN